MLSLLIWILVFALIVGVIFWVLTLFPLPPPWLNVLRAVIAIIALIWLLTWLVPALGGPPHPLLR